MNAETQIEAGPPQVYRAIADVQGELAKVGIAKNRKNTQGSGYMFRGIDDVYSALSPLLAKHGLVVVPRMLSREIIERQSQKGNALFYVTVHAEFDFVSALDGSKQVAATFGEAMDSGDKATNKAMSAAYKYAAFMTFAIPTEGDNDADATTHEVAARSVPRAEPAGPVSDGQWATLIQLSQAAGVSADRLCKFFQIDNLKELPAARYDEAVEKLNVTIQEKTKKSQPQPEPEMAK